MVVITVPFAKAPKEEIGAVEFASMLSIELQKTNTDVKILFGKDHADIINVETAQGRDTPYVRAYYEELELHDLHLNIRSFEADHEGYKDYDIMLGFFPYTSNQSLYEDIESLLDEYGVVSILEIDDATHRLSLVSEVLFDTPSVTFYVNEGAVDLFSSVAEALAEFVSEYEAHKSPLADAQVSI